MTRRSTAKLAVLLAVLLHVAALAEEPARILLIGKDRDHPYATHEYMTVCKLLAKCLNQSPGVMAKVSNGWPKDAGEFKGLAALVLYTANGGDVLLDRRHQATTRSLLQSGVGLAAIHWATAADPKVGDEYLAALGQWFHPSFAQYPVRQSTLRQVDESHAINRGWRSFPLRDEYYVNLKRLPSAQPLWTAAFDGKEHVVAWTLNRPDGGRSFGTVCGHFFDNFGDERFRRGLVNGILWAGKCEVPATGAPVTIAPLDLELPPASK